VGRCGRQVAPVRTGRHQSAQSAAGCALAIRSVGALDQFQTAVGHTAKVGRTAQVGHTVVVGRSFNHSTDFPIIQIISNHSNSENIKY
jgi:hypothetical protein